MLTKDRNENYSGASPDKNVVNERVLYQETYAALAKIVFDLESLVGPEKAQEIIERAVKALQLR
ncbi:MAG TPA: hypothetical protein VLH19_04075 [Patescibacteria group bacterium]|nr:hypothetical protein [Patescibacteria group bacterium]